MDCKNCGSEMEEGEETCQICGTSSANIRSKAGNVAFMSIDDTTDVSKTLKLPLLLFTFVFVVFLSVLVLFTYIA
ncbi:MAG: hypothetical protein ACXAB7_13700 [Candidatus Kariarchaeaceae archaeon]|jgi:uncharacterized membrane protein YvbJ